jgi:DNA gyrase subunit A
MEECKRRELQFDLDALIRRNHILDGLKIALANIDDVVHMIRHSDSPAMAKQALMTTYKLSEEQAKAILDMKLQRLANLEAIKVNNEFDENAVEIERLGNILGSQDEINKILIAALREVATKFGDGRRTQLMNLSEQVEEVEEEEVILSVTNNSSIKVVKRGAKDAIRTTNFGTLVCVTSEGKMYKIPVANILECGSAKIATLIKDNASIVYIGDLSEIKINKYWAFITANGMAKKSAIEEYNYSGRQGGKMLKLKEGDSVVACGIYTSDTETISHNGKGVTLSVLSVTGKSAMGSKVFKE